MPVDEQLLLQQMERALVRAHVDEPDVLTTRVASIRGWRDRHFT